MKTSDKKTGKAASKNAKATGKKQVKPGRIHMLGYNKSNSTEKNVGTLAECLPFKKTSSVTWLDITSIHDEVFIREIGEHFNIHPLVLEDITDTTQRSKVEEYDDYIFIIIKMPYYMEKTRKVVLEQMSILIGKNYVISLQEKKGKILFDLKESISNGKGKICTMGSDFLMYGILDAIVDNYFYVLERIGEEIEGLEEQLIKSTNQQLLTKIYKLKQELLFLRKMIWPIRELISTLQHSEHRLIDKETSAYLRDVFDNIVQVVETVETFRDTTASMLDLYLSMVSNKMNEIMKVMTIFAAIFIPLTFLTGVYGMNFEFLPELKWHLGYPMWWGLTITLTIAMLIYFKKKKWM